MEDFLKNRVFFCGYRYKWEMEKDVLICNTCDLVSPADRPIGRQNLLERGLV